MLNRSEEGQDIEENTDPMTSEDKKDAEEETGERSKDEETDEEEGEKEEDSKKEVLVIKNAWKDLADTAAAFPAQLNMDECPPLRGYEGTPKCGLIDLISMIKLTF
jgi:hypothetical protein